MSDLDVLAVLRGARELLADPNNWTTGTSARNADGNDLADILEDDYDNFEDADQAACLHPEAVCWCLGGALSRIAGERVRYDDSRFSALWGRMDKAVGPWNDKHEHADVLHVLDEAIGLAEVAS